MLKWKATAGVKSYHVQISREPTFSEVVLDQKVDQPVVRWEALPSTTFYWRVRSFDLDGRASEWSAPRQIAPASTAPGPLTPEESAVVPCSDSPQPLSLEPSAVLKEFSLELSSDSRFPTAETTTLQGSGAQFELPLLPGTYSWRGRGVDLNGKPTEVSKARKLTVKIAAPKPKLAADVPAGTATVSLGWSRSPCAKRYVVEAWHETPERATLEASEPSVSFKPAGIGEYRFRVAAKDDKGNQSEWSAESSFRVRLPAPTTPAESVGPQQPAGHEVELSWNAPAQAVSYLIELTSTEGFKGELPVTGIIARAMLKVGHYQWRVTAKDSSGHPSFPTDFRKFVVADSKLPPEQVVLVFPRQDAVLDRPSDGMIGVAWAALGGALGYELEVDGKASAVGPPPTRVQLSDGEHTLKVRAQGANGLWSSWSEPLRFFFGSPKSSRAEISFDPEPLRCDGRRETLVEVHLFDARGRSVRGVKPELSVDRGTLGQPHEELDFWSVAWRSPAEVPPSEQATLTVKERAFSTSKKLQLVNDFARFTLGATAGGRFNGGAVTSPAGVVSLGWRALKGRGRFTVHLRGGFYWVDHALNGPDGPVKAQVLAPSLSLLAGVHLDLGLWSLRALGGPAAQLTFTTVGAAKEINGLPSLELAGAVGRRLGAGTLELEVSFLYGRLDTPLAKLQAGGLFAGIGYRLDLPGGY